MDTYTILPNGCWQWTGTIDHNRPIYNPGKKICGSRYAYRVSYYLKHGALNPSLQICHKCDNPLCINPDHLFEGTNQDNIEDSVRKGRRLRKLSVSQVREIIQSKLRDCELSDMYGISRTHVARIRNGQSHTLPQSSDSKPGIESLRKLSWDQVEEIRRSASTNRVLAQRYGVSKSVIQRVKTKKTYMDEGESTEI